MTPSPRALAALLALPAALAVGCGAPATVAAPAPVAAEVPVARRPPVTVPVTAGLSGTVRAVRARAGDAVRRGDVLAELDAPEQEAELRLKEAAEALARSQEEQARRALRAADATLVRVEAKLKQTRAGLARAESGVRRWSAEQQRMKRLLPSRAVDQTTADMTLDAARSAEATREEVLAAIEAGAAERAEAAAQRDRAEIDVEVATARLRLASAERERAAAGLARRQVRAPADGVVARRSAEPGALVTAGPDAVLFVLERP